MAEFVILIDGYYLGKPSGYGRYVGELIRAVGANDSGFSFVVAVPADRDPALLRSYPKVRYHRMEKAIFPVWEQVGLPRLARQLDVDVVHFPYNTRSLSASGVKTVTTVHDLTFYNQEVRRDLKSALIHWYMRLAFKFGARRSHVVMAVSDTTRIALAALGVGAHRVYNTVDGFVETNKSRAPKKPDRPFFLHRGGYGSLHRNTDRVISAFLSQPYLTKNYSLLILGVPNGAKIWKTTPEQPVHYLKYVTDGELSALYEQATGVLATSLLEGFCLPIIEAFAFRAPVITSNIDPMKEIAGDAAMLVDPYEVEDIAAAMVKVASEPDLAGRLVERGLARSQVFSSDRMCSDLLQNYRAAISQGSESASGRALRLERTREAAD